jgi:hypothetical protein
MRRILKKIARNELNDLGDTSTLAEPTIVQKIVDEFKASAVFASKADVRLRPATTG